MGHKEKANLRMMDIRFEEYWQRNQNMSGKKARSSMLEEAKHYLEEQGELPDFEELVVKVCLRSITLEEKVEEASKPLYLERYE